MLGALRMFDVCSDVADREHDFIHLVQPSHVCSVTRSGSWKAHHRDGRGEEREEGKGRAVRGGEWEV